MSLPLLFSLLPLLFSSLLSFLLAPITPLHFFFRFLKRLLALPLFMFGLFFTIVSAQRVWIL